MVQTLSSVSIDSIGPNIPKWATAMTQDSILKQAASQSASLQTAVALLARLVAGEKIDDEIFKKMLEEISESNRIANEDAKRTQRDRQQNPNRGTETQLTGIYKVMKMHYDRTQDGIIQAAAAAEEDRKLQRENTKKIVEGFASGAGLEVKEGYEKKINGFLELAGKAGKLANGLSVAVGAITGAAAMVTGFNEFMLGQMGERANLAAELRQSGLMSGAEEIGMNFTDLAKSISNNSFRLADLAAMTQKFSLTMGVYGVQRTMAFVEELATAEGYIEKYAMNFSQVSKVAGEYLDIMRMQGQLASLTDEKRQAGMTAFMAAISTTSNVLRVSMEESAEIIKGFFEKEDIGAILATVGQDASQELRNLASSLGTSIEGTLGEALGVAALLTPEEFAQTAQATAINDNDVLRPMMDAILQAGQMAKQGVSADEIMQFIDQQGQANLKNNADFFNSIGIREGESENKQALITLRQLGDLIDNAGKSLETRSEDGAFSAVQESERRKSLAMEDAISTSINQIGNLGNVLGSYADSVQRVNVQISALGEQFGNILGESGAASIKVEAAARDAAASVTQGVTGVNETDANGNPKNNFRNEADGVVKTLKEQTADFDRAFQEEQTANASLPLEDRNFESKIALENHKAQIEALEKELANPAYVNRDPKLKATGAQITEAVANDQYYQNDAGDYKYARMASLDFLKEFEGKVLTGKDVWEKLAVGELQATGGWHNMDTGITKAELSGFTDSVREQAAAGKISKEELAAILADLMNDRARIEADGGDRNDGIGQLIGEIRSLISEIR